MGEEKSNILVLASAEPLPDKMKGIKRIYRLLFLCMAAGIFVSFLLGIGFIGLLILAAVDNFLTDVRRNQLRHEKFKFCPEIVSDEIYSRMQPILISKRESKMLILSCR